MSVLAGCLLSMSPLSFRLSLWGYGTMMPSVLVPKEILVGFQMLKMGHIEQHDTDSQLPHSSMETDMAKK